MDKLPIKDIQETIGYQFKNIRLLEQAFVRSSYANEHPDFEDNEKLEFFGDAALDYYVTRAMYSQFTVVTHDGQFRSEKDENMLTQIKSYNVDTDALAHYIELTGFQNYLLMSESDKKNEVQNQSSVMADLFEAILGAVVVDCDWDYEVIKKVCHIMIKVSTFEIDYVKWLKHWCAEKGYKQPMFIPLRDVFAPQIRSLPYFAFNKDPFKIGLPDYLNPNFKPYENEIVGADLIIPELDKRFISSIKHLFGAFMDCAKQAYDFIQIKEMKDAVGDPKFDDAVNQLNVLSQKDFIHDPLYGFSEEHDEDGNPVWTCDCDIEELEHVHYGESTVKKEAKKIAAFSALRELLGVEVNHDFDDMEEDE